MKAWSRFALVFCAAVLGANAWHLASQTAPPSWDDAWYLENSFRFYYALKEGLLAFLSEYINSFRIKAPLISVLPLPLYALFGPGERLALWVNELLLAWTLYCVYRIGRILYDEKTAAAAAIAAALMPLLYGLSRLYLVECLLTALVAWANWRILTAKNQNIWAIRSGAVLGLGLLAKSLFPLYLLGPIWLRRKILAPQAAAVLAYGALVASSWYAFNAVYVVGFGLSAGFGSIARDYGSHEVFSPSVWGPYTASIGRDGLSWPYAMCAAALLAAALLRRGRRSRPLGAAEHFLLSWLLIPLAVFSLGVNKDIRYLAPALPSLALLLGKTASTLAANRPRKALLGLLLLPPIFVFLSQTFGRPGADPLAYNGPPSRDPGWDRGALVSAISAHASAVSVIGVGFEHRLLNANNLASLSASRGRRFKFVSLGYAQSSPEGALIRLKDKSADHLVMIEGRLPEDLPGFLNRPNARVQAAIDGGRLPVRRLAEVPLADGLKAVLYRLKRP